MNKQDLIAALKGGGRTQVDPSIGQVQLNPTLGRYGNYNVVTEPTSKNNSAKQLARALMAAPQVVGQFKNIQEAAGILEANELTTEELEMRFDKGDTEADGIFSKLFKDQAFQQTLYTRKFDSEVTPNIRKAKAAIKSRSVEDLAGKSDEEYRAEVTKELTDTLDPAFLATVKDNAHMGRIHNRAMERVIPHTVEELVAWKNKEVKDYTKSMGIANLMDSGGNLGTSEYAVPVVDPNIARVDTKMRATAFGDVNIDPTTAAEVANGSMAEVKGNPLIGSSGMEYRGLEDSVPTVAVNPKSGFVAGDMIHVVSDLFPDGRVFEVAGTGPASGRLDFFATNKEDYNKLAKQELKTVTKLDPKSIEYEAKDIPVANKLANYSQAVASAVDELQKGFAKIEMTDPERATYIGDKIFNDIVFKYEQDGDLKNIDAWRESALKGNEPFIDGEPHSATAEGKRLLLRVGNFVENEEAANEREANSIGGKESTAWFDQTKLAIYKAYRVWDKSEGGPEATAKFQEELQEFEKQIYDAKPAYNKHKAALLDFMSDKEDAIETGWVEEQVLDQRQRGAFLHKVGGTPYASQYRDPTALLSILKDTGKQDLVDGLIVEDGAFQPRYTEKAQALSAAIFDAALTEVIHDYNSLTGEERKAFKGPQFEERLNEEIKNVLPQFLNEVRAFAGGGGREAGVTLEAQTLLEASKLEKTEGSKDFITKDGKLEVTGADTLRLKDANRIRRSFINPDSARIIKIMNSPEEIALNLNKLAHFRTTSRESRNDIGRALKDRQPGDAIFAQQKLHQEAAFTGLSMEIHRNGGEFTFRWDKLIPDHAFDEFSQVQNTSDPAAQFTVETARYNYNQNGLYNQLETSTKRIYNINAILKHVNEGDSSDLDALATMYKIPAAKRPQFIENQVKLAERRGVIDPQPTPE